MDITKYMKRKSCDGDTNTNDKSPKKKTKTESSSSSAKPVKSTSLGDHDEKKKKVHPFFQAVAKRSSSSSKDNHDVPVEPVDPMKIACWNVNGIFHRLGHYEGLIQRFIKEESPEVLFISEMKLRAPSMTRQGSLWNGDAKSMEEMKMLKNSFTTGCFNGFSYRRLSLSPVKRYAGTAVFAKKPPLRIWYKLPTVEEIQSDGKETDTKTHNPDGRIMFLEWKSFYTLHTYSPNNGSSLSSYQRRKEWDEMMIEWMTRFKAAKFDKHLIYLGDLNCAPSDDDLSHPDWFMKQHPSASGDPNDGGQPGCTPNEQRRFREMLQAGGLVDAFRQHVRRTQSGGRPPIEAPIYTWRGHPGKDNPEAGRFFKKGMRIDHVLVSAELFEQVKSVRITGCGLGSSDPSFLGSDHCPMILQLREKE